MPRRLQSAALIALLAGPGAAATGPVTGACAPEALQARYNAGYVRGVEDFKAQLARATAETQRQVQAQLDAQLGQLQRQNAAGLRDSLQAAQAKALADAVATPMPEVLTGGATAATRPAAATTTAAAPALPDDPARLAPGSRLVIDNAERLPPVLYAQLLAYLQD